MDYYTNTFMQRGKMYVRGIQNGKQVKQVVNYKPYLFIPTTEHTKYKNIHGSPVGKIDFDSVDDAKEFQKKYENIDGMPIYGMTHFIYPFMYDTFPGEIKYDPSAISVVSLDIETVVGDVDIATAIQTTPNEVTAITISRNGKKAVFGCGDYTPHEDNITYYKCKNEYQLFQKFLDIWNSYDYSPDVLTGWNVEFFDVPYLVGRIRMVLGEDAAKRLSPWQMLREYDVEIKGRKMTSYYMMGITVLDWMALYKKFTYTSQESYRLDHIAKVELGDQKLDYKAQGYTSLQDLYERNFQLYVEYNIHDVHIVDRLEDKMKLIELVFAIAYDAKVNYQDTLASVRQWDVIIHNYLMQRNIVVGNQKKSGRSDDSLVGGYVKDPKTGMHRWMVSFDLNSLYPHLIQQYNISPETFVEKMWDFLSIDQLLRVRDTGLQGSEYSYAANGCVYRKDKQGFLGAIMAKMYDDRVVYKKQMIEAKKMYEKTKDPKLAKEIARLNNLQMAKKIQLNSAYGALGNKYFRWYDINHAEAITMSGQLSIRWIADRMNEYLNKLCGTTDYDYIIASDTDSIYVTLAPLVDKIMPDETDTKKIVEVLDKFCLSKIEPFIDKAYLELSVRMNAYAQKMFMKREAIADKAIWTAKKRYILNVWNQEGVAYDSAKLKMSGIEAVKSSTPQSCRDNIKKALNLVMNESETTLQTFIADFRKMFTQLPFEEVAFPRGVSDLDKYETKDIETYASGTPIHVRGSILYNRMLERHGLGNKYEQITNGDKVKFCYMKTPNPARTNVISCPSELPSEFDLEKYIDYPMQFDKAFIAPLQGILDVIGWKSEKIATLEDFFS